MPRLSARRLILLFLLLSQCVADLTWGDGSSDPRTAVVLPSFGEGTFVFSVLFEPALPDDKPVVQSSTGIFRVADDVVTEAPNGFKNVTYTLSFTGAVGVADYSVSANGDELTGIIIAAGFVIKNDGDIVSGDDGAGVTVGQEGSTTYEVEAIGVDGKPTSVSGTKITPRPGSGGTYFMEIDESSTGFSSDEFTLTINKYRVGTGAILLNFEATEIELNGEFFETVLHVTQSTTPVPSCVVMGAEAELKDGVVETSMFNILSPPRDSPVNDIVLTVGGEATPYDTGASSLVLPTSTVVFSGVTESGPATITCDGDEAVVIEGGEVVTNGLTITQGNSSEPLAIDTVIEDPPTSDTLSVLTTIIRIVKSSPGTLTQSDAVKFVREFCTIIFGSECTITGITAGSARIEMVGLVSDPDKSISELQESFEKCEYQTTTGLPCDGAELEESRATNAVAATAAGAGIATWTIVVIAVVGALGLVLLVALTLWAVHRRASLNEESSYSSSGPMGVPDPSDLLYEQSIVRDVYGRGKDGGPTQEDAMESERLAAAREANPRPPSSGSGVSRGRESVDASSTYSV